MEKKLGYVMLSLKEKAFTAMAIVLWKDSDILAVVKDFQIQPLYAGEYVRNRWERNVLDMVADKMANLPLPEPLQKQMLPILKAVGLEILRWKVYHEDYLFDCDKKIGLSILEKLYWTSSGTVYCIKTAEELVSSKGGYFVTSTGTVDYRETKEDRTCTNVVDIMIRYKLACLYCLEDYIPEIWNKLPEEKKRTYYNGEAPINIAEPPLDFCWPYILMGEKSKLDYLPRISFRRSWGENSVPSTTRFHQYAFEHSSFNGNKTAAEYFFQKLTLEEKETCLVQTAAEVVKIRNDYLIGNFLCLKKTFSDVLCYLLTLMTLEEQNQILMEFPIECLSCFLDWPWHGHFLDIADVIWNYLPESIYHLLILEINNNMENSSFYFPKLFQLFFINSPINFKRRFAEVCQNFYIFLEFFKRRDTVTIEVIFQEIDPEDRVNLLTSDGLFSLFLIHMRDRWDVVKACVRAAKLSNENKQLVRERFMRFHGAEHSTNSIRFLEFLDETSTSS